jgi:hypothetical protein
MVKTRLKQPATSVSFEDSPEGLGATLHDIASRLTGESVTLREVLALLGEQGLLVFCAFLTLPFLFVVSIPGVSTVFGLVIILLGVGIAFNRLPWLPQRLMDRPLSVENLVPVLEHGAKFVARFDCLTHPRLRHLTSTVMLNRAHGLALIFSGVLLLFPLGLIPFSNTLPALAILFFALGLLQRDGYFIIAAYGIMILTIIYFGILAFGAIAAGQGLVSLLG